jgi:hypothetical protein
MYISIDNIILILCLVIIIYIFINNYILDPFTNIINYNNNKFFNDDLCKYSNIKNIIYYIGIDKENNDILIYNDKYYKANKNSLIKIDLPEITYFSSKIEVPFNLEKFELKIELHYNDYNYIGLLTNSYYYLQYIVYEKLYDKNNIDNLYSYLLVKKINNKYIVYFELQPRSKINQNDTILIYDLGPMTLK